MKPYVFLLGIISLNTSAAERRLNYCAPPASIQVSDCEDNDAFIRAGESCLNKLEADVKAASKSMTAGFSKNREQKQEKKFNSSLQDYAVSSATLSALISSADLAIADVKKYQDTLEPPEDFDEPEVNQGNPQRYMMSVDCYGDTKQSLDGLVADINHVKGDLLKAKAIADANAAASGLRQQQVDNSSSAEIIRGQGQATPAMPKGQPRSRESDVSGIKENEAKQKKP